MPLTGPKAYKESHKTYTNGVVNTIQYIYTTQKKLRVKGNFFSVREPSKNDIVISRHHFSSLSYICTNILTLNFFWVINRTSADSFV